MEFTKNSKKSCKSLHNASRRQCSPHKIYFVHLYKLETVTLTHLKSSKTSKKINKKKEIVLNMPTYGKTYNKIKLLTKEYKNDSKLINYCNMLSNFYKQAVSQV